MDEKLIAQNIKEEIFRGGNECESHKYKLGRDRVRVTQNVSAWKVDRKSNFV